MASYDISSGNTASGITLHFGDTENVFSGGSALDTTVSSGGAEYVYSGGSAVSTTVASGGLEFVFSGGSATATDLSAGGVLLVLPGGSATGTSGPGEVVSTGVAIVSGQQVVSTAPTISGAVSSGEDEFVLTGGSALGANLSGIEQVVFSGGTASGTLLQNGSEIVTSSGTAIATSLGAAGTELLESGGSATLPIVGSGGRLEVVSDGSVAGGGVGAGGLLIVLSGGSATGTTVSSGGAALILPGASATLTSLSSAVVASTGFVLLSGTVAVSSGSGTVSGLVIGAVESAFVLPGGSAVSAVVNGGELALFSAAATSATISNGIETIEKGGSDDFAVVSTGNQLISAGGVASETTLKTYAQQYVLSGGSAVGAIVSGAQYVLSGGTATSTTLVAGIQYVLSSGVASGTVVSSGSYETISAGGSAAATTVGSGGLVYVYSGGTASGAHVLSGGAVVVLPHGAAPGAAVDPGGLLISSGVAVLSGTNVLSDVSATLSGNTLAAGEIELVLPGGTALSATISAGATLYDYALATGTTIDLAGELHVDGGGTAVSTTLTGGTEFIYSGGSATFTTVSVGSEEVSSGGVASGTVLLGGEQFVLSGGLAEATQVRSGTLQVISTFGSAIDTSVGSGGVEDVAALGVASGTTVGSGGSLYVFSVGVASSAVISGGGIGWISSGGLAASPDVKSAGLLIVLPGGSVTNPDVETGGVLASGGVLVLSGTQVVASASGTLSGAVITSGETELVLPGGSAVSAVIGSGGTDEVYSGGAASGDALRGGTQYIFSGGSASFETVSGGGVTVYSSGVAISTTVASGGVLFVLSGGTTSGTTVGSRGTEYTFGGMANSTTVEAGGTQYVDGGTAIDTTVNAGGSQDVLGTSISAVLLSGANADIYTVGTAIGTTIDIGATETVEGVASDTALDGGVEIVSGGVETGGIIGAGGYLYDEAAASGVTSNVTIGSGGVEFVYSGATATGTDVQSGGTLIVLPGGSATSTTLATGGAVISTGVLILSSSLFVSAASGTLSNFVVSAHEQEIVLPQGATVSSILNSGGVEDVDSGGVASLTAITSSGAMFVYAGGTATFAAVSSGGDEIISSGGLASATAVGFGGSEIINSSGVASATIVNGGSSGVGYEFVSRGGSALATTLDDNGYQVVSAGGVATGTMVSSGGYLSIDQGGSTSNTVVFNSGIQEVFGSAVGTTIAAGGLEDLLYYVGLTTGTVVSSGGLENLEDGTASGTTIDSGGKEILEGGTATDTLLLPGGTIALYDFTYSSGGTASLNSSTDVLTVSAGGQTYTQQLAGDYSGEIFHFVQDPNVTIAPDVTLTPCYCRGTRIATPGGEVAVEDLRIGDAVLTATGESRPIRWIGRRSYDGRFANGNHQVLPVLIRRSALADDVPRRDLLVSPNHALFFDGALIPAIELVNGASIVQLETVELVEYFHLELETHDIILAEGAPAETFVDDGSRGMFHNAAEYGELYPDAAPAPARYCAPRVEGGEELQAVRARLAERTPAIDAATGAPAPLEGHLDGADCGRITGWARDPAAPDRPVRLAVLDNGVVLAEVDADAYRADLAEAGLDDGRHGFELILPVGLDPAVRHVVQVRRLSDGRELERSPRIIEAALPESLGESEAEAPVVLTMPPEPSRSWQGQLDDATRERIRGWAWEPDGDAPVALQILDNGRPIARVLANVYREDLERAGIGRGRHAFDVLIPGGLSPLARHVVEVRRERDGAMLPGAPAVMEAGTSFDAALERAIARAVAAVPDGERERVLAFIMAQADRLQQLRADTDGQRSGREASRRLRRRWGPEAERHGLLDPGLRALVIDARVPEANRDAGSQALLSHMHALRRLGYRVSFVAADEMTRTDVIGDGEAMACCGAPFYASVEDVLRRQADCFDLVYLHRATIGQRYLALARQYMPRARILYSVADLHWLRVERQAAVEDRPELLPEGRRLRFIECTAAWTADAAITHSTHEAGLLRAAVPAARVHCVPWEIPLQATRTPFLQRRGLAFIGHYGHVPNQDAAHWLVEAVMPRVWQTDPGVECLLVGSDMPDGIRVLARPGITVLGQVADLGDIYGRVRLTAAPLRYGAGVKGKVLNSLAAGVPCVMSPVAAEGLGLPPPLDRLVDADPARLAVLICRLHADEAAHGIAVRAGLAFIGEQHGAAAVDAALRAAIEDNAPRVRQSGAARVASATG